MTVESYQRQTVNDYVRAPHHISVLVLLFDSSEIFFTSRFTISAWLWCDDWQDFFVDLLFLSVDVGISYLAVLVPVQEESGALLNTTLVMSNRKLLNAPQTHTKRKRVHTWSEVGHTHMFPCFWRCFEVITVSVEVSKVSIYLLTSLLCILSQAYLRRGRCSSGSYCTGT